MIKAHSRADSLRGVLSKTITTLVEMNAKNPQKIMKVLQVQMLDFVFTIMAGNDNI